MGYVHEQVLPCKEKVQPSKTWAVCEKDEATLHRNNLGHTAGLGFFDVGFDTVGSKARRQTEALLGDTQPPPENSKELKPGRILRLPSFRLHQLRPQLPETVPAEANPCGLFLANCASMLSLVLRRSAAQHV